MKHIALPLILLLSALVLSTLSLTAQQAISKADPLETLETLFPPSFSIETIKHTRYTTQAEIQTLTHTTYAIGAYNPETDTILLANPNPFYLLHEATHRWQYLILHEAVTHDPTTQASYIVHLSDLLSGNQLSIEQEAVLVSVFVSSFEFAHSNSTLIVNDDDTPIDLTLLQRVIGLYLALYLKFPVQTD